MCRYAFKNYKNHYACFECRKAFKQPFLIEKMTQKIPQGVARTTTRVIQHQTATCPQCHKPMNSMGFDFKAPKRSDKKQWEKVKQLFNAGFTYVSCGCDGPGTRPQHLREVSDFIRERRRLSVGQRLLEQFSRYGRE